MQKKGKKGKKGKKEKDLTPDRTIESLYEELAQEGIVNRFPKVRLAQFLGEPRSVYVHMYVFSSVTWVLVADSESCVGYKHTYVDVHHK